jgi:hypothetical protein
MGSECLVDAGDRLRYCVNVSRTDDGFSSAFNISIDDDLRLIYQRSDFTFAPSTIGLTLDPAIVGADATERTGHRALPTGIFTGPQQTTGVNDVCFVIADGGISAQEGGIFATPVPNDALRRVRLSEPNVGQIVNMGNLGTTDVEAMAINATSSPFTLFAMNGAVLGLIDLQGVNPVTSQQSDFVSGGARRFDNLFVRIGPVGTVRYWTRGNVNSNTTCDDLCTTTTSFTATSITTNDIDSLTMFPYAPYELWGAARVGNLDVLFRIGAQEVNTCRATTGGCTTPILAQNTFGMNNGDGVEVYSRLINDYELSRDRRGILLPFQRQIILDIDDMAFTGNQPPKLFAIANQGSDPGALVTVFYYQGSFQPNTHNYIPVCSTAACGNTEMKRAGAPGTVELKGAFGTPDFEGMSFSPDGRLHLSTGKDSVPCLAPLTDNSTDISAGTPANGSPGGNCGAGDVCTAGYFCVQPERYCVALPTTNCAVGTNGCPCNTALSGNLQCGDSTNPDTGVLTGRRPRCAQLEDQDNVLSTTPFSVGRCVNNANCFATDNFLWQVDPQTGRLLEQQKFFLLENDSAVNNGDYEAIACNTQNPVLDVGPSSLSFCYTARVTNIAPAGILTGGSVLQSRISSKVSNVFACSPNGNRLRVSASDQTPLLIPPVAPGIVVSASSDPCTGSTSVSGTTVNDVQIGETFELTVTARLSEGTTYGTLLGVRVPTGFDTARVVLVSTASASGCGMTFVTPGTPSGFRAITVAGTTFNYLVLDFGNVTNPWDKTCGGTSFNAKDAQDDLTSRITLRLANVTANIEGATFDFTPVILFRHMNPGGVDSPVTQPASWTSLLATFPLAGAPVRIQVREPLMPLTHTLQGTSATTFREGEQLRLCATSTVQRVCAHDPDIRFDWSTLPSQCAVFTGTPTVTAPTPAGCVLRTMVGTSPPTVHCNNVLQVGESVSYCYDVRLECPPSPTPSPTPPPPSPTPFPACLRWETNPENGPPDTIIGEREYEDCETVTINVRPRVRLGNFVWSDDDRDGVQDAGEAGINGVQVELLSGTTQIASTLTAGGGFYEFSSLNTQAIQPSTAYSIRIVMNQGPNTALVGSRILTTQDAPAAGDLADSDASLSGMTATISPATTGVDGSFIDSFDFGFQPPLANSLLGNFVWLDLDGDGIQDSGEPGIGGVVVSLLDAAGNIRATTTTSSAGEYSFSNKGATPFVNSEAGWTIDIITSPLPNELSGLAPSPVDQGGNDNADSDGQTNLLAGRSRARVLPQTPSGGNDDLTRDFGFAPLRIGDLVWRDNNGNGVQDSGEPGIANVVVRLFDSANAMIGQQTTDANGNYFFTTRNTPALAPGATYRVSVALSGNNIPTNFQVTLNDVTTGGGTESNDSDGVETNDNARVEHTRAAPGALGQSDLTIDFGFSPCFTLGDRIWLDTNRNGVQDASETMNIAGVVVSVLAAAPDNTVLMTVASTASSYLVSSCPATGPKLRSDTVYRLQITTPVNGQLLPSPRDQGGNDAADSDADAAGNTATITTVPARYRNVGGDLTLDFGLQPPSSVRIGDFVFFDVDADGVQDASEQGIPGVVVQLYAGINLNKASLPTPLGQVVTDASGLYSFDENQSVVKNSQYTIVVRLSGLPSSIGGNAVGILRPSRENLGGNTQLDSNGVLDAANTLVFTEVTTGGDSSIDNSLDFGFHQQLLIGDFVWFDRNGDGLQSGGADESPGGSIQGGQVTVELVKVGGADAGERVSVTTNAQGIYRFERRDFPAFLTPSRLYAVEVRVPQGTQPDPLASLQPTTARAGNNRAVDSDGTLDAARRVARSADFSSPALGAVVDTIDFGFVELLRIGNFVWRDDNSDGVQNELISSALANVLVELRRTNGSLLGSQRTDSNGNYEFNSRDIDGLLPLADYLITIPLDSATNAALNTPAVLVPTRQDFGSDTQDSDGEFDQANQRAIARTVRSGAFGTFVETFDFGFTLPMAFGDFVFIDSNEDGIQNDGAAGVPSVQVTLRRAGVVVTTVVTGANGLYLFSERTLPLLPSTTYTIEIVPTQSALSNFRATLEGRGGDDARDSDGVPNTNPITVSVTTPAVGAAARQNLTIDFGFVALVNTVKIGNFVFNDTNRNGIQDMDDTPIGNVTLTLRGSAGVVAVTTTNSAGFYEFSSGATMGTANGILPSTSYSIVIDLSSGPLVGYQATAPRVGGNTQLDSNGEHVSRTFVESPAATGLLGTEDLSFDFGFVPVFEIGDFVWRDADGDGVQDAGETGIVGVTVTLQDAGGRTLRSAVTDQNGRYRFPSVPPVAVPPAETQADFIVPTLQYTVAIRTGEIPTGFKSSPPNQGMNDNIDSDASLTGVDPNARYAHTFAATGLTDLSRDFGFIPEMRLGDYVWLDKDGNGVQTGEQTATDGIAGVTVQLFANNNNNTAVATTTTDSAGKYFFSSLNVTQIVPNAVLFIMIDMTQGGGNIFGSLLPTTPDASANNAIDSDAIPEAGNARRVWIRAVAPSDFTQSDLTFDFGFVTQITLGDLVWLDTNGDGLQTGELALGVGGVTVQLLLKSTRALVATTVTSTVPGSVGQYLFSSGLLPNTDYVVVINVTQPVLLDKLSPSPSVQGNDVNIDSNGVYVPATLAIEGEGRTSNLGQSVLNVDFGLTQRFRLGDNIWREAGQPDGIRQVGEAGIQGVRVELYNANGTVLLGTTVTRAGGLYYFDSLDHNLTVFTTYTIALPYRPPQSNLALGQLDPTLANVGNDDAVDSDGQIEPLSGSDSRIKTTAATQNFGQNQMQFDFGFTGQARIGDLVFNDANSNGRQDAGEMGISGLTVQLIDVTQPTVVVATAQTSSTGLYFFQSAGVLVPGRAYRVAILQSAVPTFKPTQENAQGVPDDLDSDCVLSTDGTRLQIDFIAPAFGVEDLSLDFGLVNALTIGDFVWLDADADGQQGPQERGIAGVVLELYAASQPGVVLQSTATSANGSYAFDDGLAQQTAYLIRIPANQDPLATFQATRNDIGNDTTDSDAVLVSGAYQIAATTPNFGQKTLTFDFGFVPRIILGLVVWNDANNDGVRDATEPRLGDIALRLLDSRGNQLATVRSDPQGHYEFNSFAHPLTVGSTFIIALDVPPTLQPTRANVGNDSLDSDGVFTAATNDVRVTVPIPSLGYVNRTIDFGFVPRFAIGDFVWRDNGDGQQNSGEPGIAGQTLRIFNADANNLPTGPQLAEVTTNSGGLYSFSSFVHNLQPQTRYVVETSVPTGLQPTVATTGSPDEDSNGIPVVNASSLVRAAVTSPQFGGEDRTIDFGFVPTCNIAGVLWEDTDGDGQRDQGEPVLAGVTVSLREVPVNNGPVDSVRTQTTDAQGRYLFNCFVDSIEPNKQYQITVDSRAELPGRKETTSNTGSDTTDSDASFDPPTNRSVITTTSPNFGVDLNNNDFGYIRAISLGDFVWIDEEQPAVAGHGVQQASGNRPLPGVAVLLYAGTGSTTPQFRTTTSATGRYSITSFDTDLVPGTTYVIAVPTTDAAVTSRMLTTVSPTQGGNVTLDSNGVFDATRGESRATLVAPAFGTTDLTIDFGFVEPPPRGVTLGNFVWLDTDNDGRQDAGEPGVPQATVLLCTPNTPCTSGNGLVMSTATDNTGLYRFNNQDPRIDAFPINTDFVIRLAANSGPLQGTRTALPNNLGADDDNDSDGVLSGSNVDAPVNSGPDGTVNLRTDFGFIRLEVGNFVWEDENGNGVQDAGEAPIANVVVQLRDLTTNSVVHTTATDASGEYYFSTMAPRLHSQLVENRNYQLVIALSQTVLGSQYVPTGNDRGGNDATDSDGVLDTASGEARIAYTSGAFGSVDHTRDFGLIKLLEIGDFVFNDNNSNGLQDASDTPRAGVTVKLYDSTGATEVASVVTDSAGKYLFTFVQHNVQPNRGYLVVIPPDQLNGLVPSPTSPNDDPALDSDGSFEQTKNWIQAPVTTGAFGTRDLTTDFGLMPLIEIGDFVWRDANGDGRQTAGESGIGGETVILQRASDNVEVARTDTSSAGLYLFSNRRSPLRASTSYVVLLARNPPTLQLTTAFASGSNSADDSNGVYAGSSPRANVTTGASGSSDRTIDFGFVGQIRIGNVVFSDLDGNGVRDGGERGIAGATVTLYRREANNSLTLVAQQETDSTGNYLFNSLDTPQIQPNTDYVVAVASTEPAVANTSLSPKDAGSNDAIDSDASVGSAGFEIPVRTGAFGQDRLNNDFGFVPALRIGDFVWVDTDGDGLQDANEVGVADVVLQLFRQGQSARLAQTKTNGQGRYFFSSANVAGLVRQTSYDILVDFSQDSLVQYRATDANAFFNTMDAADSDFSLQGQLDNVVRALVVSPNYGTDDLTIDLGVKPSQVIGDRVWDDQNGNGLQEDGEPGILGVELVLLCGGVQRETTTSSTNGIYRFSRTVEPNTDCAVRVPLAQPNLNGLEPSQSTVGNDRTVDSNGVADSQRTSVTGLVRVGGLGSQDLTVDFGFTRGLSLGDFVWVDSDGDGEQDSNEAALPGVSLDLYPRSADFSNPNVAPIASTTSDGAGRYAFTSAAGVKPNTLYTVVISLAKNANLRNNYVPTVSANVDGQPADSDGVLNPARTHISAVASSGAPGVSKTIYDFGFVPIACIGDRVWSDDNGDGIQDANEPGIGAVSVSLYLAAEAGGSRGAALCEVKTDGSGRFEFCSNVCLQLVPSTRPYEVVTRTPDVPGRRCTFSDVQGNTRDTVDSDGPKRGDECVATVTVPRFGFRTPDTDIGLVRELLIGDRLFIDKNSDGLDGSGAAIETEPPVRGATVRLVRNNLVVEETTTDSNGKYLFGNGPLPLLQQTLYTVQVDMNQTALTELFPTKLSPPNMGFESIDSNGVLNMALGVAEASVTTKMYGTADRTIDFGFREESEMLIGRNIWIDRDNDGFRDANEPPVGNVSVALYTTTGQFIASTVSDSLGRYEFRSKRDSFRPFTPYSIVVYLSQRPLIGLVPTFPDEGKDDCIDSDGLTQQYGGFAALVINMTTGDFGTTSLCNDYGLFDCIATDPGIGVGSDRAAKIAGREYYGNEGVQFKGEASNDFPLSKAYFVRVDDVYSGAPAGTPAVPDVGVPRQFPVGSISGWDMRAMYAAFSPLLNRMYFAIDCFGICGDADGDGNPGAIFAGLAGMTTYVDSPNLGSTETFSVFIDLNQDGMHDIVMGVSSLVSGNFLNIPNSLVDCPGPQCTWQVYTYLADSNEDFGNRYGVSLKERFPATLAFNPSAAQPDLEWTVDNWSKMPGLRPNPFTWQVKFEVFAGSFTDGGIGEDRMPNENKPGNLRFLCWEIKPENLVWPNNITLPIGDPELTGACATDNCCNYGHGAGCSDLAKQQCVCAQDDYCCKNVWDKTCVSRVSNGCGSCLGITPGPTGPKPGTTNNGQNCTSNPTVNDCCTVHNYGGCQDTRVTTCVNAFDPYCVSGRWDANCIELIKRCSGPVATLCSSGTTPTPSPSPTPSGGQCEKGRLACDCRDDGTCLAGEGQCDATKKKCLRTQCTAGTPGCACAQPNNACSGDTACNTAINVCVSSLCIAGELSCPCKKPNNVCNGNYVCKTGFCAVDSCIAGSRGCVCGAGNSCEASTQCQNGVCVIPPPACPAGFNSCPCRAGVTDRCNGGLVCSTASVCVPDGSTVTTTSSSSAPTPTTVPGGEPTPAPTPAIVTGCVQGEPGCKCDDVAGAECRNAATTCKGGVCAFANPCDPRTDATCTDDKLGCTAGTAGCRCGANSACGSDATCNADFVCEKKYDGRQPCANPADADGDGIPDCSDTTTNLDKRPSKDGDVSIGVHDPTQEDKKVGTVTVVSKDGKPITKVDGTDAMGNPTSSGTVVTKPGRGSAPDGKGGSVDIPYIDVTAGTVKNLGGNTPFFSICLEGGLPGGLSASQCCLGARQTANDDWKCVSQHLLVARGPVFCGYTPHLTQFGIIPKTAAVQRGNDPAVRALEISAGERDAESSGLPDYAIALIVIGAVCYCALIIALIVLVARRRSRAAKPKRDNFKSRENDVPLNDVPRVSVNDGRVTNPAFGPESGRHMDDAIVEELSDSSLESLSEAGDGRATLNMGAYQTLRNTLATNNGQAPSKQFDEPVEREQPTSIVDMDTYQTLTKSGANNFNAGGNNKDRTAIDAAIFSALESDDSSTSSSSSSS